MELNSSSSPKKKHFLDTNPPDGTQQQSLSESRQHPSEEPNSQLNEELKRQLYTKSYESQIINQDLGLAIDELSKFKINLEE